MLSPESGHSAVRARNLSEEGGRGSGMGKRSVREPEDGKREEGKRDLQGGEERAKQEKITQHCRIFRHQKKREPTKIRREPGIKGTGRRKLGPPCPLPIVSHK